MRLLYLHGFGSGPSSRKANWFRDRFHSRLGLSLELPQLVRGPFRDITLTEQLETVAGLLRDNSGPVTLVGSSMGGYIATLFANANPNTITKLVLLAPAFGFPTRWLERLPASVLKSWRNTGQHNVFHHHNGKEEPIGYQLVTDALTYPDTPSVPPAIPTLILHGTRDETVPHSYSKSFVAANPHSKLVSYDDDHSLLDSLGPMWQEIESFLHDSNCSP